MLDPGVSQGELSAPRRRRSLRRGSVRALVGLVALVGLTIGLVDALLLASYRREQRSAAALVAKGGQVVLVDETPRWMKGTILERLFDLRVVAFVDLDNSRITDADLARLADFRHLANVVMANTAVTDVGLVHLRARDKGLIDLSRTRVHDVDLGVNHLLTILSLSGNRIDRLAIDGCWNLQELDLSGCTLDDDTLAPLAKLQGLRSLDLSNATVTDRALDHLAGNVSLAWLNVGGTRITPAGVARLRAAHPTLRIVAAPGRKPASMVVPRPRATDPAVRMAGVTLISGH